MRPLKTRATGRSRCPHIPVRAAPSRRTRLPARRNHPDRAGRGDGKCLGGQSSGAGIDERLHHLFAADPGAGCTSTASRSGRGGRSARDGRGDEMTEVRQRAGARPSGSRRARWPDPVVGVIMGSDSDWPTMQAAARAGRVRGGL
jgi:hypothetical protein